MIWTQKSGPNHIMLPGKDYIRMYIYLKDIAVIFYVKNNKISHLFKLLGKDILGNIYRVNIVLSISRKLIYKQTKSLSMVHRILLQMLPFNYLMILKVYLINQFEM